MRSLIVGQNGKNQDKNPVLYNPFAPPAAACALFFFPKTGQIFSVKFFYRKTRGGGGSCADFVKNSGDDVACEYTRQNTTVDTRGDAGLYTHKKGPE
ncbi:hypothetical protein [Shewanella algae]|uniref:hypothetical protein n=1 Tax=Shewanella algae TaxID=38313 RepID=UPI001644C1D3|nr:hypothetical protein [Shewanella algae]